MSVIVENTPRAWSERGAEPASWTAAMWSERGQTQRFLAVLKHLELREGDEVLDFGCGSGRFCEFLPETVSYHAHDWAPEMLERVRRDHERANVLEKLPDVLFDHVVCIGVFNLRDQWTREQTANRLSQLWALHTRRTLVASLYRGNDISSISYSAGWAGSLAESLDCSRFVIDTRHLANDLILGMHR